MNLQNIISRKDLKQSEELKSIPAVNLRYEQVATVSSSTDANFASQQQIFNWSNSSTERSPLDKAYVRIHLSIASDTAYANNLKYADDVALNMMLPSNLYQSEEFRINNVKADSIDQFVSQCESLKMRMTRSKGWLDTVGNASMLTQPRFKDRLELVSQDYSSKPDERTSRAELGVPNTVTIAFDGTSTFTFVNLGVNTDALFQVGDVLEIDSPSYPGLRIIIATVPAGTATITGQDVGAVVTAEVVEFTRIRKLRVIKNLELCWHPQMDFFQKTVGAGDYSLVLNPKSSADFQRACVESLLANKVPVTNFSIKITKLHLMVPKFDVQAAPPNQVVMYDVIKLNCQDKTITNAAFGNQVFDVSASTFALTVAYQDTSAASDTRYSETKFRVREGAEKNVTRHSIKFDGRQLPSPDGDNEFKSGSDFMVQRYIESIQQIGAYASYMEPESYEDWLERGLYFHYFFPKSGMVNSTRVTVANQFSALPTNGDLRVLLFDWSRESVKVTYQDGRIISVDKNIG